MPVSAAPTETELAVSAAELRGLVGKLRRRLQEQTTPGGFSPSQVAVMARLLTGGPASLTSLARAEGMRPQSMGAIIAVLENVGFVSGTPDAADGRRTILAATQLAQQTASAVQAAKDDWLVRAMRTRLSADEQADLARSIPLFARILEP